MASCLEFATRDADENFEILGELLFPSKDTYATIRISAPIDPIMSIDLTFFDSIRVLTN